MATRDRFKAADVAAGAAAGAAWADACIPRRMPRSAPPPGLAKIKAAIAKARALLSPEKEEQEDD